jgi:PAS domain S-box-containing protein
MGEFGDDLEDTNPAARPLEAAQSQGQSEDKHPSPTFERLSIEDRHRFALRYAGLATWAWDVRTDLVDADPATYRLFGLSNTGTFTATEFIGSIHPDDRLGVSEALNATIETGAVFDCRFRVTHPGGTVKWLRGIGEVHRRYKDGKASVIIGLNMDITELVESEERLEAVVSEMRHRIKNSLAMVNSLAAATARETDEVDAFVERFRGRIDALAAAQRAIGTTGDTHLVDLRSAVEGAMGPFTDTADWSRRISTDIVDMGVTPSLGQALALTIYELATNAIKYGALRFDDGTIALSCVADDSAGLLVIEWTETHAGEQIAMRAQSTGFGSKLINRLIGAERGSIDRGPTDKGYRVRLTFPIAEI